MHLFKPDTTLINIAAKASTLHERLTGRFMLDVTSRDPSENEKRISARLQRWIEVCAKSEQAKFAQRLAWDGLSIEAAQLWLGDVMWPSGEPLPAWIDILAAAVAEAASHTLVRVATPKLPSQAIPFEDILMPFVRVARRKLDESVKAVSDTLGLAAYISLEGHLLDELSIIGRRCFQAEFVRMREREHPLAFLGVSDPLSRTIYDRFVSTLLGGGLLNFFERYPVLARLLSIAVLQWVAANTQMILNLHTRLDGQQIVHLTPGLSDRHNGGQTAAHITLENGRQLIYKPHSLLIDHYFQKLLEWLNEHGLSLPLKTLFIDSQEDYGLVEFVSHDPCNDEQAVKYYYRRAGMLTGLIHVLHGTDFHRENLIAHGEHPIPIDLEMLLTPRLIIDPQPEMGVIDTELLPRWRTRPDGTSIEISAFGSYMVGDQTVVQEQWHQINTDAMDYRYEAAPLITPQDANVPLLDDQPVNPIHFVESMIDGFREMYGVLRANRQALVAPDGPLRYLAMAKTRCIVRKSPLYSALLYTSLAPDNLRDGVDRSIQLEALCRLYVAGHAPTTTEIHPLWPLQKLERKALEGLDIPRFEISPTDNQLADGDIVGCFESTGFERAMATIQNMSDENCETQVAAIRQSFKALLSGHE